MKLNAVEIMTIAEMIKEERNNKNYNKAGQTRNISEVWRNYKKTSIGRLHNEMVLKGELEEIYNKAFYTPIEPKEKATCSISSIKEIVDRVLTDNRIIELKNVFNGFSEDTTLKEQKVKDVKPETLNDFKPFFDRVFKAYGSEVIAMKFVYRANENYAETTLRVVFNHKNTKIWNLEFPFINKDMFFISNDNMYAFMYTIENLDKIISGKEKTLKFEHPYTWLSKQVLKAYTEDGVLNLYSQDIFDRIVNSTRNENVYKFQTKIAKALKNSKDNPWEESQTTPIVWFDKTSSAVSKFSFTRNVLIDSCYADLVRIGLIQGLDLLTGSTSTPAKRVKPASCWDIVRHGSELKLERIKDSTTVIEDYAGEFKCSFPAFVKTSAKRDNSCTIKDTVDFITPQVYERKFRIK